MGLMSVFHLKYRPQKIADLDSTGAREALKKILANPAEVHRDFLFTGPKGSGKTSAARILARVVNCLSPVGGDACGKCRNCTAITGQGAIDVVEIDAASNRGIDDVRVLKERAYLAPTTLRYKVFVIDEVQMMTKEAFNALLKLIEEPPKDTFFVLCTTDWEKVPETVMSRLVRVEFSRASRGEMMGSVKRVVKSEALKIDDESLEKLIGVADGSFRNLHRLLNELVMSEGNHLGVEDVNRFMRTKIGDYSPEMMAADMATGEMLAVLDRLEKLAADKVDFLDFGNRAIEYFQGLLLRVAGGEEVGWPTVDIVFWLKLLMEAVGRGREGVTIGQLPLELAVVEFMGDRNKKESTNLEPTNLEPEIKKPLKQELSIKLEQGTRSMEQGVKIEVGEIEKRWGEVLAAVRPYNHSIEAFLRATRPKSFSGKKLVVEVFYPFHKERLEEERNRKLVEEVLKKITGEKVGFGCVLAKGKPAATTEGPVRGASVPADSYEAAKEIFG